MEYDNSWGIKFIDRNVTPTRVFAFIIASLGIAFLIGVSQSALYDNQKHLAEGLETVTNTQAEVGEVVAEIMEQQTTFSIIQNNVINQVQTNKTVGDLIQTQLESKLDQIIEQLDNR